MTIETLMTELPCGAASDSDAGMAEPRWAEVYDQCRLAEAGIPLEAFLADPERILYEQGQEAAVASVRAGYRPLTPKQAEVARRLRDAEGV